MKMVHLTLYADCVQMSVNRLNLFQTLCIIGILNLIASHELIIVITAITVALLDLLLEFKKNTENAEKSKIIEEFSSHLTDEEMINNKLLNVVDYH